MNDITQIMQRWGEWVRSDRKDYLRPLNYPVPLLGRVQVLRGQCKVCKGTGRQWIIDKHQNRLLRECKNCRGDGDVMMNPAIKKEPGKCPYCKETPGEANGNTCFHCRGSGRIPRASFASLAVPAFIRASGSRSDVDDLSWRVDRLVLTLARIPRDVVKEEYLRLGRREDKCSRISKEYGIKFQRVKYEHTLDLAHQAIAIGLRYKGRIENISK